MGTLIRFFASTRRYWHLLFDPRTPFSVKVAACCALIYLILPVDLIPDWFLGPGFIDDLLVVGVLLHFVVTRLRKVDNNSDTCADDEL